MAQVVQILSGIVDHGDGSCSVRFYETMEDLKACSEQEEMYGPGIEPDLLTFTVVDGKLIPQQGFSKESDYIY